MLEPCLCSVPVPLGRSAGSSWPQARLERISGRLINNFGLNLAKRKIAAGVGLTQIRTVDDLNSAKARALKVDFIFKRLGFMFFKKPKILKSYLLRVLCSC